MIFVGGGALLTQAVSCAYKLGLSVDVVCCPVGDPSIPGLKKLDVVILETENPNVDLFPILSDLKGDAAFSINNKYILGDALLCSGVDFFNIHNGLIQRYRGAAEVCIFAALCKGEQRYGVTLHRILPSQKVDSGPVVAQLEFDIATDDVFSTVLTKSLDACQNIFELNVESVVTGTYRTNDVELFDSAYSYKNLAQICAEADACGFAKASNLGPYAAFFPKLKALVESSR